MPTEKQPRLGGQVRIMRLLVQSFCATIVLYMDLYVNRTLGSETERKYEIQRALQIIEDAGAQSTAAANFIGTLMKILHKHRIRIQRDTLAEVSNVPNAGLLSMCQSWLRWNLEQLFRSRCSHRPAGLGCPILRPISSIWMKSQSWICPHLKVVSNKSLYLLCT